MLAGSLIEFSIPDVFSLLALTRKSGVLDLTGPSDTGRVWVLGGALAFAVADVTRSPLAARLLHGGEIPTDAVEALVQAQTSRDGTQVSRALVQAGIPIDRVHQLVHDQIVDAVFDLSRWTDGTFAFEAQPAAGEDAPAVAAPAIPTTEVLEAVDARTAEWDGAAAGLPAPASVLVPVSRPPVQSGGKVAMTPAQWEILTLVDGRRRVSDIVALTGQGQFVVARLLASLVADGLLQEGEGGGEHTRTQQRATQLATLEQTVLGAPAATGTAPSTAVVPQEPPTQEAPTQEAPTPDEAPALDDPPSPDAAGTADGDGAPDGGVAADGDDEIDLDAEAPAPQDDELATVSSAPATNGNATNGTTVPPRKDKSLGPDLLSRLIDGVKDA